MEIVNTYTYDANGNQLKETKTEYGSSEKVIGTKKVLSNTYDLRNQLIRSVTEDAVINNTYNASGYRVAKSVTKSGKTTKTYFLYDGGSVIMESDENGTVTARNTYGGPLLFRTVFDGNGSEETYRYLYNAHGDVVTLLSNGAVAATYYYDSFGNILDRTGEADNAILYAGYQYDEETGLYYINARMYDPVTARFLQADTYLGSLNDPLSLNLYTYCLNNPHRYTDPSGHVAITAAAVFLAVRIGISLLSGFMSAKAEYDRQEAEGDNYTDWGSVLFVGAANAGVSFATFGIGSGAVKGAGVGAKLLLKQLGKAVGRDVAIGAVTDAGIEAARQLATGTKVTNLEYDRITEAGVLGGIIGGGSTVAGAALEALANTRVVRNAAAKAVRAADRGGNAIKRGFAKLASANGKVTTEAAEKLAKEPQFKLDLQFFSDDVVENNNKSFVDTPYGKAYQEYTEEALKVKQYVDNGGKVYRGGTIGRSKTVDAQFWAIESPLTLGYADKYGVDFSSLDYIAEGTVRDGTNFITRQAPGLGKNAGGAIEVVTPPNSVDFKYFHMIGGDK